MDHVARTAPTRWRIWQLPGSLIASVLAVELTAAVLVVLGLVHSDTVPVTVLVNGLLVLGTGLLHTEVAAGIERIRRFGSGSQVHVNLASVWFFAAAALLPPALAACVSVILHGYLRLRSEPKRAPFYRHVFTSATFALAALASSAAMSMLVGKTATTAPIEDVADVSLGMLVLGMLVFLTLNTALVGGAIAISDPESTLRGAVGDSAENLLEIATLCLGAIVAVAMVLNLLWVFLLFPALLVLHRSVLVSHLAQKASLDGKTGLLNAAAWHTQAEQELRRARRRALPRAVLVVDLDHFKQVNDRHGHLAGDRVLAAVADALRAEVRERDLVGRFGGEEFVVLLGGTGDAGEAELTAVAERIRLRIAALRVVMPTPDGPLTVAGLSASVGAAFYPQHGDDLRDLLQVADTALYAAKRSGRNAVRTGVRMPPPVPMETTETR